MSDGLAGSRPAAAPLPRTEDGPARPTPPLRSPALLVLVLAGVQFLVVLDSLAVALALPSIGADLSMGPTGLAWVVTAYSLALASGLLLAGRLSDLHGRRPVLLTGQTLLTGGAVLATLTGDGAVLIGARLLQGAGAALAYPPALSLTAGSFPTDPWRGRAFAAGAVAGSSGTVAGAVFGGVVTGELGWAWTTFGLTIPPGLLLLGLGHVVLPRTTLDQHPASSRRRGLRGLDLPGAALAAAAVTAALLALTRAEERGPTDPLVLVAAGAAVVLTVAFVAWERRANTPLLSARLVRSHRLLGGCLGIASNSVLYSAVVFIGTLHLQDGAGMTPTQAGLAFLPVSLTRPARRGSGHHPRASTPGVGPGRDRRSAARLGRRAGPGRGSRPALLCRARAAGVPAHRPRPDRGLRLLHRAHPQRRGPGRPRRRLRDVRDRDPPRRRRQRHRLRRSPCHSRAPRRRPPRRLPSPPQHCSPPAPLHRTSSSERAPGTPSTAPAEGSLVTTRSTSVQRPRPASG